MNLTHENYRALCRSSKQSGNRAHTLILTIGLDDLILAALRESRWAGGRPRGRAGGEGAAGRAGGRTGGRAGRGVGEMGGQVGGQQPGWAGGWADGPWAVHGLAAG